MMPIRAKVEYENVKFFEQLDRARSLFMVAALHAMMFNGLRNND